MGLDVADYPVAVEEVMHLEGVEDEEVAVPGKNTEQESSFSVVIEDKRT